MFSNLLLVALDLGRLRKALLVMHAPLDSVVAIDEAEKIYREARHPKSFVSLDDADHLLSRKQDADYVATVLASWADRYLTAAAAGTRPELGPGEVRVAENDRRFAQDVYSDSHHWLADEPRAVGGTDRGPDPYEHLLAALGTCTAMTLRMYAGRKSLPLEQVSVELRHRRDYREDCEHCDDDAARIEVLERTISLRGELTDAQRRRLLEIADRCPVHRTLHGDVSIRTRSDGA